nr:MAG TPA: hypothetical protein [Caudoviricetes sp.]
MDRLTKYSEGTTHENGICCTHFFGPECLGVGGNCAMNCKWEEAAWSRLAAYEDTGLAPLNVNNMKVAHGNALSTISELRKALVDKREELKTAYDSISQLDGANSSLMAANEKLAADRKALINELCQYCGKYKYAHEGACYGCRWRDM